MKNLIPAKHWWLAYFTYPVLLTGYITTSLFPHVDLLMMSFGNPAFYFLAGLLQFVAIVGMFIASAKNKVYLKPALTGLLLLLVYFVGGAVFIINGCRGL